MRNNKQKAGELKQKAAACVLYLIDTFTCCCCCCFSCFRRVNVDADDADDGVDFYAFIMKPFKRPQQQQQLETACNFS